jgi:prepilin-type N-terminal cleavage/methylation domain-containing protein
MNKFLKRRATSGFTLIEVLVVVIIIAILFGIAAPGWLAFLNSRRVSNSQDQVVQSIRRAQAEALRTRRPQTVTFNTTVNPPLITVRGETEQLGYGSYPSGQQLVQLSSSVNPAQVNFDENGTLIEGTTVPIIFTLTAPSTGAKRCVVVETLLGAIRKVSAGEDTNCPS